MATTGAGRQRRGRGFRTAASLVEKRIRDAGQARGFSVMRMLTHWPEIVGTDLARISRPSNVSYGKGLGATLTLVCSGAAAPLVQMQGPRIIEKVNACYGYAAISHVRIVQTAPDGFDEPPAGPPLAPKINPEVKARADDLAQDVSDPELREALRTLACNVFQRRI